MGFFVPARYPSERAGALVRFIWAHWSSSRFKFNGKFWALLTDYFRCLFFPFFFYSWTLFKYSICFKILKKSLFIQIYPGDSHFTDKKNLWKQKKSTWWICGISSLFSSYLLYASWIFKLQGAAFMRAVYTERSNFSQKEKLTNWPRWLLSKNPALHLLLW